MNIVNEVTKVLLWACIEDYAGLWELLWEVNSKFPETSEAQRKKLSLDVTRLLLDNELIKLYLCKEPYGELSEIDTHSAISFIGDERNWEAPEFEGISVRAGATKKGEALYEAGAFDLLS